MGLNRVVYSVLDVEGFFKIHINVAEVVIQNPREITYWTAKAT